MIGVSFSLIQEFPASGSYDWYRLLPAKSRLHVVCTGSSSPVLACASRNRRPLTRSSIKASDTPGTHSKSAPRMLVLRATASAPAAARPRG